MSEISNIIKNVLGENTRNLKFDGEVYFEHENDLYHFVERTSIDRDVFNKVINETNAAFDFLYDDEEALLDTEVDLLLIFNLEYSVDKTNFWEEKKMEYFNSLIILEAGLINSYSEENKSKGTRNYQQTALSWEDIDQVELFSVDGEDCFFRFYQKNETRHDDIYAIDFCTSDFNSCRILCSLFNDIIDHKKKLKHASINEHAELQSRIDELLFTDENYEVALKELEVFKDTYEVEDISFENTLFYHLRKALVLYKLELYEEALNIIDNFIKKHPDDTDVPPIFLELKGEILMKMNKILPAINYLALCEEVYEKPEEKENVIALKEESYSKLKEVFLEVPFNERKLIFIGDAIYPLKSSEMIVLKKNDLPLNVHFPVGHPHVNEVYTCHPHKQDFYLPLKSYSEELFLDRIHEFSWLLQSLGAAQLEITSSKSDFSDQTKTSKKEVDVQFDYKVSGAKVNYQGENSGSALVDGNLNIAKKQVFKPKKAPFVPNDLVWYHSNSSWQRLANQRLNGSIMMHSELISSSQSETISTHELTKVEAELKLLLPKLGVKYNKEEQISTTSTKKHEWMVNVEFADVNDLLPIEQPKELETVAIPDIENEQYNLNLEKYREDVLLMIEDDGMIDESERNILIRKIKRYGLTEEDARAIENDLTTSGFSENELSYIQELKELLEDGEITDIERRILDRYAGRYGVSTEVQKKIDAIYIPIIQE